jgi:ATP diphosphatase
MTSIDRLLGIMTRLRDPERGCAWDVKQTFASIAPYTIEEAYEVAHAIDRGDLEDLRDELGDLLLQVVYHAQIAREQDAFSFEDVVEATADKLVRRHPHVFGDQAGRLSDAERRREWEAIKAAERAERSQSRHGDAGSTVTDPLADIPRAQPALMRARKLLARMLNATGRDLETDDDRAGRGAVRDFLDSMRGASVSVSVSDSAVLGTLLQACVREANARGWDAEQVLREANRSLESRVREALSRAAG